MFKSPHQLQLRKSPKAMKRPLGPFHTPECFFFASDRDPLRWARGRVGRSTESYPGISRRKLHVVRDDIFYKNVISHSFCRSISAPSAAALRRLRSETLACGRVSFPNRTRFAGLRFGIDKLLAGEVSLSPKAMKRP